MPDSVSSPEVSPPGIMSPYPLFRAVFAGVIVVQALHMVEHIAQVVQRYGLGQLPSESHGLLGMLDLEWVHFLYNGALLLALFVTFALGSRFLRESGAVSYTLFTTALWVQSYHMIEHVVKIVQHLRTGRQGTPGILGPLFVHPIWFHFWINLVVTALVAVPYVMLLWKPRRSWVESSAVAQPVG